MPEMPFEIDTGSGLVTLRRDAGLAGHPLPEAEAAAALAAVRDRAGAR
jgi:hypothetical protein